MTRGGSKYSLFFVKICELNTKALEKEGPRKGYMATNRHKYQFDLEGIIRGYALYHVLRKSSISFHRAYLKAQPFRAESRFLGSYQYPQGFPKCGGLHRLALSKWFFNHGVEASEAPWPFCGSVNSAGEHIRSRMADLAIQIWALPKIWIHRNPIPPHSPQIMWSPNDAFIASTVTLQWGDGRIAWLCERYCTHRSLNLWHLGEQRLRHLPGMIKTSRCSSWIQEASQYIKGNPCILNSISCPVRIFFYLLLTKVSWMVWGHKWNKQVSQARPNIEFKLSCHEI